MQYRYIADGWLGALIGNRLYFDFSVDDRFNDSLAGLVKELGDKGLTSATPPKGTVVCLPHDMLIIRNMMQLAVWFTSFSSNRTRDSDCPD
jgi:hypothetical protein